MLNCSTWHLWRLRVSFRNDKPRQWSKVCCGRGTGCTLLQVASQSPGVYVEQLRARGKEKSLQVLGDWKKRFRV